jgi:hypothetical protein
VRRDRDRSACESVALMGANVQTWAHRARHVLHDAYRDGKKVRGRNSSRRGARNCSSITLCSDLTKSLFLSVCRLQELALARVSDDITSLV